MNNQPTIARALCLTFVFAAGLATFAELAAAGPLQPAAGPVGPTMKPLTEVEPRIAVNAQNTPGDADATPSVYKITAPGSYYLTGNVQGVAGKSGIEIVAINVTLDLNGFQVAGVNGTGYGVRIDSAATSVTVRNGAIYGWTAGGVNCGSGEGPASMENLNISQISGGAGIDARGPVTVTNCRVNFASSFGIRCSDNAVITGCAVSACGDDGIQAGTAAVVSNCSVSQDTHEGISVNTSSIVKGCTATNNGTVGILAGNGSTVVDCAASSNTVDGIRTLSDCTVSRCTVMSNAVGINAFDGTLVESCAVTSNTGDGIKLNASCSAVSNQCRDNGAASGGAGISATSTANRIDGNHCVGNGFGLKVTTPDNFVVRNTARGNASGNYSFPAGSEYGQIITNPGNAFVSTNPWANFAF